MPKLLTSHRHNPQTSFRKEIKKQYSLNVIYFEAYLQDALHPSARNLLCHTFRTLISVPTIAKTSMNDQPKAPG